MTNAKRIRMVAAQIAEAGMIDPVTFEEAQKANEDGWTLIEDMSQTMQRVHEGVVLSQDSLQRAWDQAVAIWSQPEYEEALR